MSNFEIASPTTREGSINIPRMLLIAVAVLVGFLLLVVLELHGAASGLNHITDMSGVVADVRIAKWLSFVLVVVSLGVLLLGLFGVAAERSAKHPNRKFIRVWTTVISAAGLYLILSSIALGYALKYDGMLSH